MLEDLKLLPGYDGLLYLVESQRNPSRLKSHHHVELELNLVVQGTVTYVVSGRRFTFGRRTMLWLYPQQEHQLIDLSKDAQNYVAVFTPPLIARSAQTGIYTGLTDKKDEEDGVVHTMLEPDSFDLIRRTMDSLMRGSLDADLLNREAGFGVAPGFTYRHGDLEGLNAGLHHLLLLCWRSLRTGRALGEATLLHPAVRKALKLLSEVDWGERLSDLAEQCGVSEAYLSRTFHRQIGVPLSRYRNSLRLSQFWEIYRQPGERTVADAVYAAGFGSYAQFYKVFAEAYGQGPRACLQAGQNAAQI
jgi:AraC-like DNA-binding protein